jgi:hypothetical protein
VVNVLVFLMLSQDPVAFVTRYYTYQSIPCVRLALPMTTGQLLKYGVYAQCADPSEAVASPVCCALTNSSMIKSNTPLNAWWQTRLPHSQLPGLAVLPRTWHFVQVSHSHLLSEDF